MYDQNKVPMVDPNCLGGGGLRQPDLVDQLKDEKTRLEARLQDINAALAALDAHPDMQQLLRLIHRVSRF